MRSEHYNSVTVVGVVHRDPHVSENGRICHFVLEMQSLDYSRSDGTRHFPRIEEIPVRCHGKMMRWAVANIREGQEVFLAGALQTQRVTDKEGRTYRTFYVLSHYVRIVQPIKIREQEC